MFKCYHCGKCCEDVCTQINLTLGDIKRLCDFTGKSAIKLYKEGIIGIFPFGDPFKENEFETGVGLFIPCKFREEIFNNDKNNKLNKKKKKDKSLYENKRCSIYPARPLNCRLFPYWILSDAPLNEIKTLIGEDYSCMKHLDIDIDFINERKRFYEYKEKIVKILFDENDKSDILYEKLGLKSKIITKKLKTKEDFKKEISKIIIKLKKIDYSKKFREIDKRIKKQKFLKCNDIPEYIE